MHFFCSNFDTSVAVQNSANNDQLQVVGQGQGQARVQTFAPGGRRQQTTAMLAMTIFAVATSVGVTSFCPQLVEANITIRVPTTIILG